MLHFIRERPLQQTIKSHLMALRQRIAKVFFSHRYLDACAD